MLLSEKIKRKKKILNKIKNDSKENLFNADPRFWISFPMNLESVKIKHTSEGNKTPKEYASLELSDFLYRDIDFPNNKILFLKNLGNFNAGIFNTFIHEYFIHFAKELNYSLIAFKISHMNFFKTNELNSFLDINPGFKENDILVKEKLNLQNSDYLFFIIDPEKFEEEVIFLNCLQKAISNYKEKDPLSTFKEEIVESHSLSYFFKVFSYNKHFSFKVIDSVGNKKIIFETQDKKLEFPNVSAENLNSLFDDFHLNFFNLNKLNYLFNFEYTFLNKFLKNALNISAENSKAISHELSLIYDKIEIEKEFKKILDSEKNVDNFFKLSPEKVNLHNNKKTIKRKFILPFLESIIFIFINTNGEVEFKVVDKSTYEELSDFLLK